MKTLLQALPSPDEVECLIEPFTGSASVFLNTGYRQYLLADSNADLINTFRHVCDAPEALIAALHRLYEGGNCEMAWQRNRLAFNTMPSCLEKAALFIYLNRHGYNGLCRYNKKGQFNVPFGRQDKPYLPEHEIRIFSRKASRCHVSFFHTGFEETLNAATTGMFAALRCAVYCDPPYLPLNDTSAFTAYDGTAFTATHHRVLVSSLHAIHEEKKFPVVVSTSDSSASRIIYRNFVLTPLKVNRSISSTGAARKAVSELTGYLS